MIILGTKKKILLSDILYYIFHYIDIHADCDITQPSGRLYQYNHLCFIVLISIISCSHVCLAYRRKNHNRPISKNAMIRRSAIYEMMDQKQRKLAELREKLLKEREEYYKKKEEVKNR